MSLHSVGTRKIPPLSLESMTLIVRRPSPGRRPVWFWLCVALCWTVSCTTALSSAVGGGPSRVLVTGASGRTGQLVFEALLNNPEFEPKALVRSEKSAKVLRKRIPATRLDQIVVCDVTKDLNVTPPPGQEGCEAMVICTSAVPKISKVSLLKQFLKIPFNLLRGKKAVDFRSMKFVWQNGQYPEKVDYEGQVAQIDLAKKLGMKQVVVVSSMGGTDPSNFLNSVGKNPDGSGNGDILLWKRKAERYLVESGLFYTVLHPGGLVDKPAGGEEFVLDVDDKLLENKKRSISRADVANLCVAALTLGKGQKIALDCITREVEAGLVIKSADEALSEFLNENKVYNYAL